MNGTQVLSESCQCPFKAFCNIINCSNDDIIDLATEKSYKGNVLTLYQFWIFFILVVMLWMCVHVVHVLQNPICLDLLGKI